MKIDVKNTGKKTVPGPDRHRQHQGQGRRSRAHPVRRSTTPGRPRQRRPPGLGPGRDLPPPVGYSTAPGGAETSNAEDLLLRPGQAGQVGRSGLEALRRPRRQIHRRLRNRRRPERRSEGRRPPPASAPAAPSSPTSAPNFPKPKSTPPAKSSKSNAAASRSQPAANPPRGRCIDSAPPSPASGSQRIPARSCPDQRRKRPGENEDRVCRNLCFAPESSASSSLASCSSVRKSLGRQAPITLESGHLGGEPGVGIAARRSSVAPRAWRIPFTPGRERSPRGGARKLRVFTARKPGIRFSVSCSLSVRQNSLSTVSGAEQPKKREQEEKRNRSQAVGRPRRDHSARLNGSAETCAQPSGGSPARRGLVMPEPGQASSPNLDGASDYLERTPAIRPSPKLDSHLRALDGRTLSCRPQLERSCSAGTRTSGIQRVDDRGLRPDDELALGSDTENLATGFVGAIDLALLGAESGEPCGG